MSNSVDATHRLHFGHTTVLQQTAIDCLVHAKDGLYIDATFGRGGHTHALLNRLSDQGRIVVFDKDPQAISVAETLQKQDARLCSIEAMSFAQMDTVTERLGWHTQVDGILFDLGVSSPQLDDGARGFSFMHNGPLDMRMNNTAGQSASQWLDNTNEAEIADVLYHYGEERYARRIAKAIVQARSQAPIEDTKTLADIVSTAHPKWPEGKHPATKTFQAIRIHINAELADLETGLRVALETLKVGGRLVVISFHSLEDRIVKRFMRDQAKGDSRIPHGLPVADWQLNRRLKLMGKAIKPTADEVTSNPRARSAVMRVAEKLA